MCYPVDGDDDGVVAGCEDGELLEAEAVDLVVAVEAGEVAPVALDDVDELVHRRVLLDDHLAVVALVLLQDRLAPLHRGHARTPSASTEGRGGYSALTASSNPFERPSREVEVHLMPPVFFRTK